MHMTSPFVQFFENVNFSSSYKGLSAHQIWDRVKTLSRKLEICDISETGEYFKMLSGNKLIFSCQGMVFRPFFFKNVFQSFNLPVWFRK